MRDDRLKKLAKVLVEYSTEVKQGDCVCVSAEDGCLPFLKEISKAVIQAGGLVQTFVDFPEIDEFLLKNGTEEQIFQPNFRFGVCANADVWISAWGTENIQTFKNCDPQKMKQRRLANQENRKIYTTRAASGELRWCGTQFPTNANAQYAQMSLDEYEDFVYQAGFLEKEDPVAEWKKQAEFQQKWVEYLNTKNTLHILSKDTDLYVGIKGRRWINCCGKENFPDGEIFTSPEENRIDGKITFSLPAIIQGQEFHKVCLQVKNGLITEVSCDDVSQLNTLLSFIDTDQGSRRFGEVAIGTNYGIRQFTRNILFDEKIGGTMHMAVGCAMPEAGGKNESAIHWDMINDMKEGKIYADDQMFYENGKFLDHVLNQ